MGTLNTSNLFQSWDLSESESREGTVLFTLQKQVLQNRLAMAAAERVMLTFSPENVQRDAELQGEIRTLRWIIDESERIEIENSFIQPQPQQEDSEDYRQDLFKSIRSPGPRPG